MVDKRQNPNAIFGMELPRRRQSPDPLTVDESSSQVLTPGKSLAVIINTAGKERVTVGSVFSFSVAISNQGNRSAIIDVSIDDRSGPLQQWCVSLQERLALGPNQSGEVIFPIRVPNEAAPGIYPYLVIVDAQDHYPEETPIQFDQQLQILPTTQDTVSTSDPTFVLQPVTAPAAPAVIQPGGSFSAQVLVYNRSDRVDRFRLVCPDLPRTWIQTFYPQGLQGAGLVVTADSLNLNPGEQGLITLTVNPPLDALAGNYTPTLRLYSENNPDLVLLDLLYLQVPPIHLLQAELRTLIGRVRQQAGLYQIRLNNTGNLQRGVMLRTRNLDGEDLCTYRLSQTQVQIAPKDLVSIDLEVKPHKWWRRPMLGGGRVLNFSVELEDTRQLPLTIDQLPGYLLWEPRPWWQFLPFLLLGVLGVLSLAYLIWWVLFRVPPSPKVVQFFSEDSIYTAANDDVVRLGWQISDPERVKSLRITGLSAEGVPLTRPEVYDFSRGVPSVLQPFCTQTPILLDCRNVATSARRPGTYQFELLVLPEPGRRATSVTATTKPVTIAPLPEPTVLAFTSTQPVYQEISPIPPARPVASKTTPPPADEIRLNWAIANPSQLRSLQLTGRTPDGAVVVPTQQYDFSRGIPDALKQVCVVREQLICQNVKTTVKRPGDYVFELLTVSKNGPAPKPEPLKTELIKILPRPSRILEFKLNGKPAMPKYVIPVTRDQPVVQVLFSWQVDASEGSRVELLPAPGSVPLKGTVPLILSAEPGSTTVTLQVTSITGQQLVRSVTLETFDPSDPAATAAAAAAKAIAEAQQAAGAGQQPGGAPGLEFPSPAVPEMLSPIEIPPQFDRR